MQEKLEVIRGGLMFAVKVTYYSGRTEIKRGFATQADAEGWTDKRRAESIERIGRDCRQV